MINIINDFITIEEEHEILSHLVKSSFTNPTNIERNSIVRYGSPLPYNSKLVGPIPKWIINICERVFEKGLSPVLPDSVTVNEYHKGQVIDWHIDSMQSGPVINVLSLASKAVMGLKKSDEERIYVLNPRSMVHMSEDERFKWKHCIYPVEAIRYSIVFRKGTELLKDKK